MTFGQNTSSMLFSSIYDLSPSLLLILQYSAPYIKRLTYIAFVGLELSLSAVLIGCPDCLKLIKCRSCFSSMTVHIDCWAFLAINFCPHRSILAYILFSDPTYTVQYYAKVMQTKLVKIHSLFSHIFCEMSSNFRKMFLSVLNEKFMSFSKIQNSEIWSSDFSR